MISLRLAWWQWRASWRDLLFFAAATFFCVLSVVGVTATGNHVREMMLQDARAMLGADLRLQSSHAMAAFKRDHLQSPGWRTADLLEFTANAATDQGEQRMVEVKAVSPEYPLRGEALLTGGGGLGEALAGDGAVVEASLLSRLALGIGDRIRIGDARFTIRDTLAREPDRVTTLFSFGPRVLIPRARAEETGLLQFGSRMRHITLLRLAPDQDPLQVAETLTPLAGRQGIRVVTAGEGQPTVRRFIERFRLFLTMMGLLAAGVAGVGMAIAAAARLREQKAASAILRTLGASRWLVLLLHLWQALFTGLAGGLAGSVAGLALPWLLLTGLAGILPGMGLAYQPSWELLWQGVALGGGVAMVLVAAPVWQTAAIRPAILFRSAGWQDYFPAREGWSLLIPLFLMVAAFLLFRHAGDKRLALAFLAGSAGGILVLWGLARLALAWLGRWCPADIALGFAVQGIRRRESGALGVILALGLGLATVQTMMLLEDNLQQQLHRHLPKKAPSFFFLDIQPDQAAPFAEIAREFAPEEQAVRILPVVRGRLTHLRGEEVTPEGAAAHGEAWRFEREYVLTWSAQWPAYNELVAGHWWRDDQELGASLELGMAKGLGLQVGDRIGFNIQGVVVDTPIVSLRKVHWSDMGLNFFVIFSPETMAGAPASHLATIHLPPEREEELLKRVAGRLPNVTAIPTRQIMEAVATLLTRLGETIRLLGILGVAAGLLVLAISVAASRRRRGREAAICRLLGATRQEMSRAMAWEFLLLGGLASLAAMVVAQGITAAVVAVGMDELWQINPLFSLAMIAGGALLTGVVGMAGAWRESGRAIRQVLEERP